MKKITLRSFALVAFVFVAGFAMSCGDDGPLKECIVCTDPDAVLDPVEQCGNVAAMEAAKTTYEGYGYSCHKK